MCNISNNCHTFLVYVQYIDIKHTLLDGPCRCLRAMCMGKGKRIVRWLLLMIRCWDEDCKMATTRDSSLEPVQSAKKANHCIQVLTCKVPWECGHTCADGPCLGGTKTPHNAVTSCL
jgi:hypothetical protein